MIRRFLTRVLIVALLAFCGYNWTLMRSLQAQVTELQRRTAAPGRLAEKPPDPSVLSALLSASSRHTALARLALARSDWKTGQRELQAGIDDLTQAAQSPDARRKLEALQAQTRQLQEQVRVLWQHTDSQTRRVSH